MNDVSPVSSPNLDIRLGNRIARPSPGYGLLVGFHFGRRQPDAARQEVVSLDLPPLEHDCLFETWWYHGEVVHSVHGRSRVTECEEYAVAILIAEDQEGSDFERVSRDAYEELVESIESTAHGRIVKIWNYIGGINTGQNDLERYRRFSVGRADAFRTFGIGDEDAPTGTAIGTSRKDGLTLIALASNQDVVMTENPRQVSAFRYPRKYGRCSPKFSRAGRVASDDHRLYLLSGTAAVVGHQSAWPHDIELQTDETLRNLDALCAALSRRQRRGPGISLQDELAIRVYLRNPGDLQLVKEKLRKVPGTEGLKAAFLQGQICRRELVVEIDGAAVGHR